MNNENSKNVKWMRYWKKFLVIVLVVGAVVFSVSLMLPIRYQANSSVLITQKDASGLDAYKEVKSAEFTGKIAQQVILSNAFMEGVSGKNDETRRMLSGFSTPEDKIKAWRKAVRVDQVTNTGVLNLIVLAGNRDEAKAILESIVNELQNES
jgi:capsular polysaccharide biosynthesis protein